MDSSPLPIPAELRQALAASGGLPIQFEDPETHKLYLLVEQTDALDDEYFRAEIEKGLADIEAGRFAPWDIEATLAEARRRLAQSRQ